MNNKWNDRLFMNRAQIREYDRIAIEKYGIPGAVLMENAGRGTARVVLDKLATNKQVAIVAGPGNNGGDGFVIARHLLNAGCDVTTFVAVAPGSIKGDARTNYDILKQMGALLTDVSSTSKSSGFATALKGHALIVDALLGTGVDRNVEGHLATLIQSINGAPIPVLAVDIPSGLDADTGTTWGETIQAETTTTYGHLKEGLLVYPGVGFAGDIKVIPIGVPASVSDEAGTRGRVLDDAFVSRLFPSRKRDAHKGSCGHLAVVAGSLGKSGAAVMTGKAAMRSGAGLVTIATTQNARQTIEPRCIEVMVEAVIEKPDAAISDKVIKKLTGLIEGKTAVALGPGLTTSPGISALAMRFLQSLEIPAVVDADGINILAADPSGAGRIQAPMVFTPHPGEMARLMGKTTAQIQADRMGSAHEAAQWHKVTIVLKGANTIIATPEGNLYVNPTGNPGMASGGMGDVLTGMIGSFLAQGLDPADAAILGTYLHGLAADRCVTRTGMAGLIATDVIAELPSLLAEWEANCS